MGRTTITTLIAILFIYFGAQAQKDGKILKKANQINNEGYALLQDGFYNMAIETFKMAIALDSSQSLYYINLKQACEEIGDKATMITYLEKAKRNLIDDDEIFYYSGNYYQEEGIYDQAIEDYSRSIDIILTKESVQSALIYAYYFNRANSYYKSEQYDEAIEDFSKTINYNPTHHGAFTNRGIAKYYVDDIDGACDDWSMALDLGFYEVGQYLERNCRNDN